MPATSHIRPFILHFGWMWVLYLLVQSPLSSQEPRFKNIAAAVSGDEEYNCLYQDKDGLIWTGTSSGLYMFDGIRFIAVSLPDSVRGIGVTAFWQEARDMYWIGFESGDVYRYDGFTSFTSVIRDHAQAAPITSFLEDKTGQVWIGTYGQGVRMVSKNRIYHLSTKNGLSDNYVYTMISGNSGKIWMGTDNGINVVDPAVFQDSVFVSAHHFGLEEGLPDLIIRSLDRDSEGRIWIGMHDGGVARYHPEKEEFIIPEEFSPWSYGPVVDLKVTGSILWVVTSRQGIIEYTVASGISKRYTQSENTDLTRISSLMDDKEGNLWLLGSNQLWISFANKLRFIENLGDLPVRNIHALIIDQNDRIWFANDMGVFSIDIPAMYDGTRSLKHYPVQINLQTQKILSLHFDVFGFLWIGTFGQGVIRMDPLTGRQTIFNEADGLENGNILSIDGNEKEIWFGTLGGAYRVSIGQEMQAPDNRPEFEHFGQKEGLVNNFIYQVSLTEKGTPYFATDGNGVFVFVDGHFTNILDTTAAANNVVYSLSVGPSGNLWLNRANEGLLYYDGNRYERINADEAHRSVVFSGIFLHRNELVMAYNNGIDIMNLYTGTIRHYESNAGIDAINPDLNTIAADSNGDVWIGTATGIIRYRPSKGSVLDHPVTRLNSVSLFLEPVNYASRTGFDYRENHFTFSYSGLWYQYPEKVEFMVKLEGHDLNWMKTRNNTVVYSDLRPGHYTFRVKSGIYGNYQDTNEESYSFVIRKPFYQAWYFYVAFMAAVVLIVWGFIRQRVARVKRREELIQERIRYQFENLKSQLNPHFLFNSFSTLIALIEDDSREAVNYVEELSNLFRVVLEYKDQDLITLEEECRLADNYIRLQKRRFGNGLNVTVRKEDSFPRIHIPPLTLQLLIENAIKHNIVSREHPLTVKVFTDTVKNTICVENNIQLKKEDQMSMGIGINNIVNRYKLLTDRKVEVTDNGSVFHIALPVI